MRQGEILGLRWLDVDLDRHILFVRQILTHDGKQFVSGTKTSSGVRSIALDAETVTVMREHRELTLEDKKNSSQDYQDDGLVVCSKFGDRIRAGYLNRAWYKLLADSGLPKITFHDLRHPHTSSLLKNNVHPKIVSERLGHASIQITLDGVLRFVSGQSHVSH